MAEKKSQDVAPNSSSPGDNEIGRSGGSAATKRDLKDKDSSVKTSLQIPFKALLPGLLGVVIIGVIAAGGYYGWLWFQQQSRQQQGLVAQLQEQLAAQDQELRQLRDEIQNRVHSEAVEVTNIKQQLNAVEQRLDSHNKRLLSLSSADREDWRLAEAEYLLQMANQRLVVERDARNAEALLSAADKILRDLDDINLFPVRESVNRDLTALKLAVKLDREGIFLRLSALSGQIESLPLVPPQVSGDVGIEPQAPVQQPTSWSEVMKESFFNALKKLSGYIRVRHHDQTLQPLLPPNSEAYLRQNFRFMLERAQLALLREQTVIYRQSLQQARDWLQRYYPLAEQKSQIDAELADLQQQAVVQTLPDISNSLEQLQAYIEKLHKLESVTPPEDEREPLP